MMGIFSGFWEKRAIDKATKAYRETIRINPQDTSAYSNLGVALAGKGFTDEAIKAHREVIRLDPQNASAYNNLGIALAGKGFTDEAIKAYREAEAIKINPQYYADVSKFSGEPDRK